MVQQKGIRLGTMRLRVQSLGDCSVSWGFGIAMSCGVGHRCSWDPVLLWLWYRPAVVALIQPLAWESPYVVGAALKSKKKKGIDLDKVYIYEHKIDSAYSKISLYSFEILLRLNYNLLAEFFFCELI